MVKCRVDGSKEKGLYKNGIQIETHQLHVFEKCFLMNFGKRTSEIKIREVNLEKEKLGSPETQEGAKSFKNLNEFSEESLEIIKDSILRSDSILSIVEHTSNQM